MSDDGFTRWRETTILAYGILAKMHVLLRRYWLDTVLGFVSLYVFFVALFAGGTAVGGQLFTRSLDAIIVGFFLFSLASTAYVTASSTVLSEAQWGTLEQLYLSPHGFGRVLLVTTVLRIAVTLVIGSLLLGLMLLTTGRTLRIDVVTVVPVLLLTLLPALGVGFVFGGLALLYKRVQSAFQLVQFAIVGLIALPVEAHPDLQVLPMALGSHLLQDAMVRGVRLWAIDPVELAVLVAVGVAYAGFGYGVLRMAIRVARKRGVLGHY